MTSKNGIEYDYRQSIKYDNKLVGWRLYRKGVLGGTFVGYLWRTKTGNAEN